MKKTLLLSIGGIFLLLLVGVWAYLFFVGTPESVDEVFSDLSFGGTAAPIEPVDNETGDATDQPDEVTPPANQLSQLTTVPVAGFSFLSTQATSSPAEALYVEQGTGHIYHYALETQQRTRISNTTVPGTQHALLDDMGQYAVLETNELLRILPLDEQGTSSTHVLNGSYHNLHLTSDDQILYTQTDTTGTTAYQYDIETRTTDPVFSIPIQDVVVLWNTAPNTHHVYNAPAETLQGHLYEVQGSTYSRMPITGTALQVAVGPNPNSFFYTTQEVQEKPSSVYWENGSSNRVSALVRPDKCTTTNEQTWCAFDITDDTSITDWYKGTHSFSDSIWEIDPNTGSSRLVVNLTNQSGREVDVVNLTTTNDNAHFLLQNQRDGFLWTYRNSTN